MLIEVSASILAAYPLIYIVPHFTEDPTLGVYLAEPIADILAVAFTTVLFIFQFRKALKAIEAPPTAET